jgi:hypothetical protein
LPQASSLEGEVVGAALFEEMLEALEVRDVADQTHQLLALLLRVEGIAPGAKEK